MDTEARVGSAKRNTRHRRTLKEKELFYALMWLLTYFKCGLCSELRREIVFGDSSVTLGK
jgi:hypothetical protein